MMVLGLPLPVPIPIPTSIPRAYIPLLLHFLLKTLASLSLIFRHESHLPLLLSSTKISTTITSTTNPSSKITTTTKITPQREATDLEIHLLLFNYGGLLLAVNFLILGLLIAPAGPIKDEVIRHVTGCLSMYHAFPQQSAARRIGMEMGIPMNCLGFPVPPVVDDEDEFEFETGRGPVVVKEEDKKEGEEEEKEDDDDDDDEMQNQNPVLRGPVVQFIVRMVVGGLMSLAGFGLL